MRHRLLGLIAVLALLAAACGDDDATSDADADADADDESTSTADADTATDDDGSDGDTATDDSSGDNDADDGGEDDGPLTASFRGVTGTEIKIGIGFVDASDFGFDSGDLEAQWQVAIDRVNDAGGINGRMLAPFFGSFSPVGAVEAEEVCVKFTEDEEVFAFVGFIRQDNELCYTELNDTIAVNSDSATAEAIERSNGLLFTPDPTKLGLELLAVEAAADAGMIDGHKVHINSALVDEPLIDPVREALEAAGAEVTGSASQTSDTGDVPAVEAEHDLIIQRMLADGADTVFAISDIGLATTGAMERTGGGLTVITTHANSDTYINFGTDPGAIDISVFAAQPFEILYDEDAAGVAECIADYEASSGNTVNVNVIDPDPNNFPATIRACRGTDLFAAIATAAGVDLTNDSFLAAAGSLGEFDLTGATAASMAADKVGADDSALILLEWDDADQGFVPAS